MDQFTRDSLKMERNGDMELINGQINQNFKEIGLIIILKEMENIYGQMVEYTKVNGKIINCMEKEFTHGLMVEDMKVNMN